jgi:antitoxin PrlF
MTTGDPVEETKVSDRGMVTIPAGVRQRLDIAAGDKLRWRVEEDGTLTVEVVHQREGVFDDLDPVDAGETDAVEAEREFGSE